MEVNLAAREGLINDLSYFKELTKDMDGTDSGNDTLLGLLTNLRKKLEANEQEIQGICSVADRSVHNRKYMEVIVEICKIERNLCQVKSPANAVIPPQSAHLPSAFFPQLFGPFAPMALMEFSGNRADWPQFSRFFLDSVKQYFHLTSSQKLHYLRSHLKGDALSVVLNIVPSENCFEAAWDLLVGKYDRKKTASVIVYKEFINYPAADTADEILKLVDATRNCIRNLELLGIPLEVSSNFTFYCHVLFKLPHEVKFAFKRDQSGDDTETPSVEVLLNFLQQWAEDETCETEDGKDKGHFFSKSNEGNKGLSNRFKPSKSSSYSSPSHGSSSQDHFNSFSKPHREPPAQSSSRKCIECGLDHHISKCSAFLNATTDERYFFVKKHTLCSNCLNPYHKVEMCRSNYGCKICSKRHNSLLHRGSLPDTASEVVAAVGDMSQVLLATAIVHVTGANGKTHVMRAFLDNGSQVNLLSSEAAKKLGVSISECNTQISLVGNNSQLLSHSAEIMLHSHTENFGQPIKAYIVPSVITHLPQSPLQFGQIKPLIKNKMMADPAFYKPDKVDLLLGAKLVGWVQQPEAEYHQGLVLQNTKFGWIIFGEFPESVPPLKPVVACVADLSKFWEVEEIPTDHPHLSKEENDVEEFMSKTMEQLPNGRFQVQLPFKFKSANLGPSRHLALKRLQSLEKRFKKDPEYAAEYMAVINDYFNQGHLEVANDPPTDPSRVFYLPHHGVVKDSSLSTRLRVVFDGSCASQNGVSLNAIQANGPRLQQNIFHLLIKFRTHPIALTADIRQMYRQVLVHPKDRDLQRILWRRGPGGPVEDFCLTTVTFGQRAAGYLAVKALVACADSCNFPPAAEAIKSDFYVDDLISGSSSIDETALMQVAISETLAAAGFPTHKWASNCIAALKNVPANLRAPEALILGADSEQRALGIVWKCQADEFKIAIPEIPGDKKWTKRTISSLKNSLYDPLGWVSPFTITAKIIHQNVFKETRDWDKELSKEQTMAWVAWVAQIEILKAMKLPRCIEPPHSKVELVGFCDASERAYAAVIYARITHENNVIEIRLIASKTKVAPTRTLSIPRLELQGSLLLANLVLAVKKSLKFPFVYAYTDSTVTLGWLQGDPSRWKTFVANRVAEITRTIPPDCWQHVKGEENPADLASRGVAAADLVDQNCMWWNGPPWLRSTLNSGSRPGAAELPEDETRTTKLVAASLSVAEKNQWVHSLLRRYDHFSKLNRVVARLFCVFRREKEVNVELLNAAKSTICRWVQEETFEDELSLLKQGKPVKLASPLASLNPFLDNENIIRVGGRLSKSNMGNEAKHPVILPSKHPVTGKIIRKFHTDLLHAGPTATDHAVRRQFWIIHPYQSVKMAIHHCTICNRAKAKLLGQQMADLPKLRSTLSTRPFLNCGVDYAGPVTLRTQLSRGTRHYKGYIALFICFSTRAIHLELVNDLSTESFVGALQRFVSRRGVPSTIHSDNGTNFVGAARQFHAISQDPHVQEQMNGKGIKWLFIPPSAPHMGGLWEAGIKSMKTHLTKIVGITPLTYEEFYTLLCRVEAVLNSRPLLPMSSDPESLDVLTPGHFIIGSPLTAIPERQIAAKLTNAKRWEVVKKLAHDVWQRWSKEYLSRLQNRPKWWRRAPNLEKGALVLIHEQDRPPLCWRRGRVINIHPDEDGIVRIVTLHTAYGPVKRPVHKLCLLPLDGEEHTDISTAHCPDEAKGDSTIPTGEIDMAETTDGSTAVPPSCACTEPSLSTTKNPQKENDELLRVRRSRRQQNLPPA